MKAVLLAAASVSLLFVPVWTWTPLKSGVTATLRGISAANDTVIWASGSNSTVLRTTDAGATWRRLPAPSPDRLDLRDVDAVSPSVAYVLSIGLGQASQIFKTVDAGEHWTQQYANDHPKVFFDAMTFWDEDHGIVLSDSVDGQFFFMMTDDGGERWTRVPAERLPPALENEGFFAASGTNVAVRGDRIWIGTGAAAKARVLRSADRGRTWEISDTPLRSGASAGIYSIAFRDDRHGVIVGGDYAKESDAVDNLAVTSDGGATWALVTSQGLSGFRSVVAYVPGTVATVVAVGPQGSDVSTDDGRTWEPIPGTGFHTLSFAPRRPVAWAAGGRGSMGRLDLR